ncbi:tautomerase family protein [Parafrankia sp. EUN1f]|uniref:tautomerase family protein n=1 Tax=Parafrankia sp. EUN1f TaxID=102897 RepID=UPI0001C46366|nr:tautomerase family protein [Parafrankia sp. EUN1f]EFC81438.1 4-oxalocrotonate tautomerase [Parafrankia sp. EUN1f]
MPLIDVSVAHGRTPRELRALMRELHLAARRALDVPDASIRVIVREVPRTHWATGDVTLAERAG